MFSEDMYCRYKNQGLSGKGLKSMDHENVVDLVRLFYYLLFILQTLEKHIQSLNNKDMAEEEMRKEIRKLYENLRSLGTFE